MGGGTGGRPPMMVSGGFSTGGAAGGPTLSQLKQKKPTKPKVTQLWEMPGMLDILGSPQGQRALAPGSFVDYGQDPMDQTKSGTGENANTDVANLAMNTPTMSSGTAQTAVEQLSGPTEQENITLDLLRGNMDKASGDNTTNDFYAQFMTSRPDIPTTAGLDPYYDNAERRGLESINTQAASRGAYGSSAALDMGREFTTDLRADQAKNEADYNLRALGERRLWETLGGDLAGQSDEVSQGWLERLGGLAVDSGKLGLDRFSTLSDITGSADAAQDDRWRLAGEAGQTAQLLGDDRAQRLFDNTFKLDTQGADMVRDYYSDIFEGDQLNFDNAKTAEAAAAAASMAAEGRSMDYIAQMFGTTTEMAGDLVDMGKNLSEDKK